MTDTGLSFLAYGAQLLQAPLAGQPLFYLSPGPCLPGAARRGGVPVLFPQFANTGPLPKHGFARNREWARMQVSETTTIMQLDVLATDYPAWPHAARLTLESRVAPAGFRQILRIENTGLTAFSFTGGLHPYWAVSDVARCQVDGLTLHDLGRREVDEWHAGGGPLTLTSGERSLRLEQQGFEGWQVWNPGAAHTLTDMPHDDWRRFICLEPVIMTPRWLQPGEGFVGEMGVKV